jgi:2-methylcitrate dehydratase PrpD
MPRAGVLPDARSAATPKGASPVQQAADTPGTDGAEEGATARLSRFVAELRPVDLPEDVLAKAQLCTLDALACILAGIGLPWTRMLLDVVRAEGGAPRARIPGTALATSLGQAALVGATAGHGFEMDDIHAEAHLHAGSLAVPVALALADANPALSGQDVLTGVVAGYEAGLRVGLAATGALFQRGHHFQGTAGIFVAAATAAHLLRLDAATARHAFGIAGSFGAGLMAAQEGAMSKRVHAGHAAQWGLTSALLAARGMTGITEVLETPYGGFLSTLSGAPDVARATEGLGEEWKIREVGFKPWPTAASIHAVLGGIAGLMREGALRPADVAMVEIHCSTMAHRHCAWPYRPAGVTAAQMNMAYCSAAMVLDGAVGPAQFREERLADPALLDFMATRLRIAADPAYDAGGDRTRHRARVAIVTRDGRRLDRDMPLRPGSPGLPMTQAEATSKFDDAAASGLPGADPAQLRAAIRGLHTMPSARRLLDLLSPAVPEAAVT